MNIVIQQACTNRLRMVFKDTETKLAKNLTGCSFVAQLVDAETAVKLAEFELDEVNSDLANGLVILVLRAEEADLEVESCLWDCLMKDTLNEVYQLVDGVVTIDRTYSRFPVVP